MATALGAVVNAHAGEQASLSSDRPDLLVDPEVVGKGRFQLEFGGEIERQDRENTRTRRVSTPTLLRAGLTERLELQVESDARTRERETALSTNATTYRSGWADTALGLKWSARKADAASGAPGLGALLAVEMPTGSRELRGRGVRPLLLGLLQFQPSDELDITVNAGLRYDSDDGDRRFLAGVAGVGFKKEFGGRVRVLAELVARQLARQRHGGSEVLADVGLAYLLSNSVQVDALVGRGVTNDSPKYLFTAGVSVRF